MKEIAEFKKSREYRRRLVLVSVISSLSLMLMLVIRVPILPFAPFLTYDFSEIPALLAGFLWGPLVGVSVVALKDLIFFLMHMSVFEIIGVSANFAAGGLLVGVCSYFYNLNRADSRNEDGSICVKNLILASVYAVVLMTILMIPVNICIFWLFSRFFPHVVAGTTLFKYLAGAVVPFNALKGVITCLAASGCVKRLAFLKK